MKKLISLILCTTLIFCLVFSSLPAAYAYDYYEEQFSYAMNKLDDGEFAYFSVYHNASDDTMIYDYAYWVKANNLLPDPAMYSESVDNQLFAQYKEYYKNELARIKASNDEFFAESFTADGTQLVYSGENRSMIVVYAEKTEIEALEAQEGISVHYEGTERSQAQWRIDDEQKSYFNPDYYQPGKYELIYGLHFYEDHTPEDARFYGIGYMYSGLYYHYAEAEVGTPDYILISAGENVMADSFGAGEFGNYIIQRSNLYYPYIYGYYILTPHDMRIMTLSEAYSENLPGLEDVFTDYGLGVLRGDVNGDGIISIKDATAIQKHIAELDIIEDNMIGGLCERGQVTQDGMFVAYISDFDRDLNTTIKDVTAIQKQIAGIAQNDPDYKDFENNPIPEPTTTAPRTDAQITIGNQTFEAQVGDTITISGELTCTEAFRSIYTRIKYDPEILNVVTEGTDNHKEFFKAHCPNLPGGSLFYYGYYIGDKEDKGRIAVNSLSEDGIDFTKEKLLFTFDLNVVSGGDVTIEVNLENIMNLDSVTVVEYNHAIGSFSYDLDCTLEVN